MAAAARTSNATAEDLFGAVAAADVNSIARALADDPAAASMRSDSGRGGLGVLHVAAEHGNASVIDLLLAAGADPAMVNDDGQTPLHIAVAHGHTEAVERLTSKQPCEQLRVTDHYKMLPLHLACEDGDPKMVALLLARGATQTPNSPTRPMRTWDANGLERADSEEPPTTPQPATSQPATGEAAPSSSADAPFASPRTPAASMPPASPMSARRKQLLAMQAKHGGSAVFIARQHEHHEAVRSTSPGTLAHGHEMPWLALAAALPISSLVPCIRCHRWRCSSALRRARRSPCQTSPPAAAAPSHESPV